MSVLLGGWRDTQQNRCLFCWVSCHRPCLFCWVSCHTPVSVLPAEHRDTSVWRDTQQNRHGGETPLCVARHPAEQTGVSVCWVSCHRPCLFCWVSRHTPMSVLLGQRCLFCWVRGKTPSRTDVCSAGCLATRPCLFCWVSLCGELCWVARTYCALATQQNTCL